MIRVINNIHFGWDTATGYPINQYIFAISDASELPSSPWTDPRDGSMHIIKGGSRSWDIGNAAMYGYKDSTWTRQFTMNGGGEPLHGTITGVPPLSFKANGKPLVSWSMLGNSEQTGTPTPDAPIMPTFCGVRTGNLAASVDLTTSNNINICTNKSEMMPNTPYSLSFYSDNTFRGNSIYLTAHNPEYSRIIGTISGSGLVSSTFSLTNGDVSAIDGASSYSFRVFKSETDFSKTKNVMLNSGSTALPYEPYGYKIPITCSGQTTPVYLGQVLTVRRIKKLVLTGEETFISKDRPDAKNYMYVLQFYHEKTACFCSHMQHTTSYPRTFVGINSNQSHNLIYMCIGPDLQNAQPSGNTVAGFKEYLAAQYANGTPVTVWCVLANPETGIVNEPLAKIGDYADELHSADAGVSIPTVKGQNTLTVDTELQPSEMTIEY